MNKDKIFVITGCEVHCEDDIFVIRASNKREAQYKYLKENIFSKSSFIEYLEDRTVNMSYFEDFFITLLDEETGKWIVPENEVLNLFKKNVYNHFEDKKQLADEVIYFYFDRDKTIKDLSQDLIYEIALSFKDDLVIKEV